MDLCYIDESGTPDVPGNTTHYVLAGLSIPDQFWRQHHTQLDRIKSNYRLDDAEIHVAWMMRKYFEQSAVSGFEQMTYERRRSEVNRQRRAELFRLQKVNRKGYKQTRKNYLKTDAYVHLTLRERRQAVTDIAKLISNWGVARLFAECIDKVHFDPTIAKRTVHEQAFEQVVSRFEQYLNNNDAGYGLLIHDNNQTVAKKHTELMKSFLRKGTLWTQIEHIIETPMFVDSQLTSMVQLADLCAYAIRRYLENSEEELFDLVFQRAHRVGLASVGVRQFTSQGCSCKICTNHAYTPE
ncbi:MAG: DUF3800 domain-containing protein [Caldilineaceae bacterium SB0665_bin_25]|nr:DUF3800 domain-containing protein [Caldilineaceae bacterium SB0665_bin_25]